MKGIDVRVVRIVARVVVAICILAVGVAAWAIAFGTADAPPPLASVYDAVKAMDVSGAPSPHTFQARDGTALAYRGYEGEGDQVAVLIHGSTSSSLRMHPLAKALNLRGFTVYAPDVRGHGASGQRGDIDYIGQLDDDLADFVAVIRQEHPGARLALAGFSAGGGFTLRIAGGKYDSLFDRYVLLAPYLGHEARTNQAGTGGWAAPYVPRIIAIAALNRLGVHRFDGLPVVAYARRPDPKEEVPTYSFRLCLNFQPHSDYVADFRMASRPIKVLIGAADDEMIAANYALAIHAVRPDVDVIVLPGIGHIEITTAPEAIEAILAALMQ